MRWEIVDGDPLVTVVVRGPADRERSVALLAELEQLLQGRPPACVLIDATTMDGSQLELVDLEAIRDTLAKTGNLRRAQIAVLAPMPALYGRARMPQGLAGDELWDHIAPFRTRDQALAWLFSSATS